MTKKSGLVRRYLRYVIFVFAVLAILTVILLFLSAGPQRGAFIYQIH